jgi:hypothetical protein
MERDVQEQAPDTQGGATLLDVTPRAAEALHDMLVRTLGERSRPDGRSFGFRIVPNGGERAPGLGLTLDSPRAGDVVVDHEGFSVLILDAFASKLLDRSRLDLVDLGDGTLQLGLLE